ncbi:hypothetical protein HRH59_03360 [Rheinheimera sp. YQF-2]|uniref:Uncharacterized protein n=1 Tax=Rheinheimera lutimaris TaxID=2740584 RepID=A0A7Y5ANH7_9GAMM|nr:hypothetical protein [Rheinheimera lutimaris]NRQ41606.1 hypothetical protein [Rheinheimera lutimaris]
MIEGRITAVKAGILPSNNIVRPLMADSQQLQDIAKQLRELQRTSPVDVADLADWDASARKFSSALGVPLPPQVMHYLHDADIRIKDPEYRASQDEMIAGIISDLESGIVPASTGTTLSLHPRWLGAIALVVLVIIYLVVFR